MSNQLSFILLIPLILWSTFQGVLYIHASQIEETVNLAAYEGQKEASLQGHYDEEIYKEIRDFLVEGHGLDPDVIKVEGTEIIKPRGERITITVTIPSPIINVLDVFGSDEQEPYTVTKHIMSEHNPV